MNKRSLVKVLMAMFLVVSFLGIEWADSSKPEIEVKVTNPSREGTKVGKEKYVEGTASLPGGDYLWVLAHRIKGFEDLWWPQGEARIDPVTKKWGYNIVFGGPQDVGYDFEIAVIVVNGMEHDKLKEYRREAMKTGHWPPIEMPPTAAPPVIVKVKKKSHR